MEVEQAHEQGDVELGSSSSNSHATARDAISNGGNVHPGPGQVQGHVNGSAITPPSSSSFDFQFPPTATTSTHTTPNRRRQAPPPSIPNFPSSHEPRNPPPAIPFSPSPTHSPAASSPFRSPDPPTPAQPNASSSSRTQGFNFPVSQPFAAASATPGGPSGMHSPWLSLAATSGAPTPSLESGPMGRSSPHLGYPFERLNIGGSWSGANLWGEEGQGRRGSQDSTSAVGSSPIRGNIQLSSSPPVAPPPGPVRGLSSETLMRYKAMASGSNPLSPPGQTQTKMNAETSSKPSSTESGVPLPAALARRRGSLPKASSVPSLSLPPSRAGKSPSPLASSSTASSPGAGAGGKRLQPITPRTLQPLVSAASTLILDVRPPSSFQSSHIPNSHSLPIPSTLLRRPAFNLEKLAQMLPSPSMEAVNDWRSKGDIVLLDADSGTVPDSSVLDGLASKFEREGFTGHIWFIKGGHAAVASQGEIPLTAQGNEEEVGSEPGTNSGQGVGPASATTNKGLLAGRLATLAFQHESTGGKKIRAPPPTGLSIPPTPGFSFKSNPFGISMPGTMSSAATERPLSGSRDATAGGAKAKFQPANPFFDNIRQNLELSHGGITERIPLNLPDSVMSRVEDLPEFLKNLATMPEKDSMDALAKQFYELELSEQKRLQAIMEWHSKGSGGALGDRAGAEDWIEKRRNDADEVRRLADWKGEEARLPGDYFPFSITAGVERGTKNRYKNIWPYDFSRVRLEQPPDQDSDYINASYVQPRGTTRRYIATQGPLDATYHDFWTLVWEQNVRVIVMITKQFEGGLIKCGNYWGDSNYGSLRLNLVHQTGGEDLAQQPTTGFDFGQAAVTPRSSSQEKNIKRVFRLANTEHPEEPPRTITQIQCVGWPDFDVPETPETLGSLIREVDQAVDQQTQSGERYDRANQPPVLVHCSAGVGRTGSFIVVDAILDGLRRELRRHRSSSASSTTGDSHSHSLEQLNPISSETGAGPALLSPDVARNRSGDSGTKAVAFLSPDITASPSDFGSKSPLSSSPLSMPTLGQPLTEQNLAESSASAQAEEEKMDLDVSAPEGGDAPPSDLASINYNFLQHRGSISTTVSSDTGDVYTRRPSLASRHSSDLVTAERQMNAENRPVPIIRSDTRHRTPSPITEMENPVPAVLEGMRVQRMSLVQSLRQYLFVHRAIITNYLHMLDEERLTNPSVSIGTSGASTTGNSSVRPSPSPIHSVSGSGSVAGTSSLGTVASVSTASTGTGTGTSTGTDDDEGAHVKRRASPTELEVETERSIAASGGVLGGVKGSGLSKRPSFKKMRQAVEGMASDLAGSSPDASSAAELGSVSVSSPVSIGSGSSSTGSLGSGTGAGPVVSPLSPKAKGRLRSRSKLGLSAGGGQNPSVGGAASGGGSGSGGESFTLSLPPGGNMSAARSRERSADQQQQQQQQP
ncbi:hypothetical protein I317_06916 [Kwoniella heveanensis CBS 569]|nr:hypothetical protein I317_06916 [Kwoniella heveanensis CBS 569]